jgi:hypothetical protein
MSETEKAMAALVLALNASSALPDVRRDLVFDDLLEEVVAVADDYGRALLLRHGEAVETVRRLGEGPLAYELMRAADVEWIAAGDAGAGLSAFFDDGLSAVFAALEADPTLGGNVVRAEITTQPDISIEAAGGRTALVARVRVDLLYSSPRAY